MIYIYLNRRLKEIFIVSVGQLKRTKFTREFCLNCELNKLLFFFLDKKRRYSSLEKIFSYHFLFNLTEKSCFCQFFFVKKHFKRSICRWWYLNCIQVSSGLLNTHLASGIAKGSGQCWSKLGWDVDEEI